MRHWLVNLFFVALAVCSGIYLFSLKYRVTEKEDELKMIHRQIINDSREIHVLKGDWAMVSDPNRLRQIVQDRTDFKPIGVRQVVQLEDIPFKMVLPPVKRPDTGIDVSQKEVEGSE